MSQTLACTPLDGASQEELGEAGEYHLVTVKTATLFHGWKAMCLSAAVHRGSHSNREVLPYQTCFETSVPGMRRQTPTDAIVGVNASANLGCRFRVDYSVSAGR
jgi:hypothetical protein